MWPDVPHTCMWSQATTLTRLEFYSMRIDSLSELRARPMLKDSYLQGKAAGHSPIQSNTHMS